MDDFEITILQALAKDVEDGDGYVCFEIIEPYVNSNRDEEIEEQKITEALRRLHRFGFLAVYRSQQHNGIEHYEGLVSFPDDTEFLWYRISPKGLKEVGARERT